MREPELRKRLSKSSHLFYVPTFHPEDFEDSLPVRTQMNLAFFNLSAGVLPPVLCVAASFAPSFPARGVLIAGAGAVAVCLSAARKSFITRLTCGIRLWGLLLFLGAECFLSLSMRLIPAAALVFATLLTVSYTPLSGRSQDSPLRTTISATWGVTGASLLLWGLCLLFFPGTNNMAGYIPAGGATVCILLTIIFNQSHIRWNM